MSSALTRSARGSINQLPCVFASALHHRCAVCSLSLNDSSSTPERLLCTQPLARAACAHLYGSLRDKSRFTLGLRQDPLGHPATTRSEVRAQCGGLTGLRNVLDTEAMSIDVQRLLERIESQAGGVDKLPWEEILRAIALWPTERKR